MSIAQKSPDKTYDRLVNLALFGTTKTPREIKINILDIKNKDEQADKAEYGKAEIEEELAEEIEGLAKELSLDTGAVEEIILG